MVIALSGRLDAAGAPATEAELSGALGLVAPRLVIDLTGIDYISSAGLRVLLVVAKKVQQANGKVVLFGLGDNVREVFEISGFDTIFSIAADLKAAIAAIG